MARVALRVVYVLFFLALAVLYYELLGAGPTPSERAAELPWWKPFGWARTLEWEVLEPLREIGADTVQARHEGRFEPRSLIPLGLFSVPVVLLTAAGFALFRSAFVRAGLLALGLTLCAFAYYGWLDLETWQDYSWRWPAVLLSTAVYVGLFALAPAIVGDLSRRSRAVQVGALLAFAVPIHLLSIEVTGTNPTLQWNLSPWPTLTLYGYLLIGLVIGAIEIAAGLGLVLPARIAGARGVALGALAAAVAAAILHRIPFAEATPGKLALLALPAALVVGIAGGRGDPGRAARCFLLAGLVVVASIKAGQWHAEWFLARARNEIAPQVIDALERYYARHEAYPSELVELVPEQLPAIRQPRIGWLNAEEEVFTYTDLGNSFLLEFSGPIWVQCAYSPPYEGELDDEDVESDVREGAWSCQSRPPRLW